MHALRTTSKCPCIELSICLPRHTPTTEHGVYLIQHVCSTNPAAVLQVGQQGDDEAQAENEGGDGDASYALLAQCLLAGLARTGRDVFNRAAPVG